MMITTLAAVFITLTLIQTLEGMSLIVAEVGDNVTLTCSSSHKEPMFYWHKFRFGFMPQTIVRGSYKDVKVEKEFSGSRINFKKEKDLYYLQITSVTQEDEAAYLCLTSSSIFTRFVNVTHLKINDGQKKPKCYHVKQTPQSVQFGDSTPVKCSLLLSNDSSTDQCPAGVYWFKTGSNDFHPNMIYSPSNVNDKQSCDYSLLRTNNSLDSGVYYCAVLTCGQVLFGQGTIVETGQELKIIIIVLGVLLTMCLVVIVALVLYMNKWTVRKDGRSVSHGVRSQTADHLEYKDGEAEGVNYAALTFPMRKSKRVKHKSEECIYSETSAAYVR